MKKSITDIWLISIQTLPQKKFREKNVLLLLSGVKTRQKQISLEFWLPGVISSAELVDGIVKLDPELCLRRRFGKLPSSVSLSPSSDLTGVPGMNKKEDI